MRKQTTLGHIYKITNKINGKAYVGQTRFKIEERWKQHVFCAFFEKSSAHNNYLQKAIRKYGENSFTIEELESCPKENLGEREKYWIAKLGTMGGGYNLTYGGEGRCIYTDEELLAAWNKGGTLSETSKDVGMNVSLLSKRLQTLGISQIEIFRRGVEQGHDNCKKPIYQYDLDGNFIAEYGSVTDVVKTHPGFKSVSGAINGRYRTAAGYQWRRYKADKIEPFDFSTYRPPQKVFQYSLDGKYIKEYPSAEEAAKYCNIGPNSLRAVCRKRKKQLSCGGFQWRYKKYDKIDPMPELYSWCHGKQIGQYDMDNNLVHTYKSIYSAAKEFGSAHASISAACRSGKPSKGYYWRYISA